ncbi:TRAP transporter large permease subunit [Ferrovibrio sp.]|uniref:TRAP transporter large permease n=1 Tax=Ferrovibrio sp. TaxID=1917215 RepID=UPI001B79FDC0|nr:TRAP transporter large permease subunit [Ferrovibrio sp.]MBP7065975.1 TRAP transporter large permease subunit [Ferrovibrio sp.]
MSFFIILGLLIALLYTGMPMFAGMFLFSAAVLFYVEGSIPTLGEFIIGQLDGYLLVAIPLFMLMSHFMVRGKVVDDLYGAAHTFLRHIPGGLGIATVFACTVFAAISGSSVATALTIGAVAIPQMLKYGYSPRGAYGVVAGGGTLGILIPPSAPMVLYGVASDTSVGALFMAGVFPGILMALLFAGYCWFTEGRREQKLIHAGAYIRPARASLPEMGSALKKSFWALTLPPFVLGGMYFGIFTATEAAATGALWALLIATLVYRKFGLKDLWQGGQDAARTSAVLFLIIVSAGLFGHMLTKLHIPDQLVSMVVDNNLSKYQFLAILMVVIFILGLILESFSIILITTPVILPVMAALGIDKVWYGVLLTINLELALISPPVGMNLIVIRSITGAPLVEVDKAAIPYMLMMAVGIALIMLFPELALWLPSQMQLGR